MIPRYLFIRFPNEETRNLAREILKKSLAAVPMQDLSSVADVWFDDDGDDRPRIRFVDVDSELD